MSVGEERNKAGRKVGHVLLQVHHSNVGETYLSIIQVIMVMIHPFKLDPDMGEENQGEIDVAVL